nr:MAG TPA: hypothetical protein [Caudoviricetes sp.]
MFSITSVLLDISVISILRNLDCKPDSKFYLISDNLLSNSSLVSKLYFSASCMFVSSCLTLLFNDFSNLTLADSLLSSKLKDNNFINISLVLSVFFTCYFPVSKSMIADHTSLILLITSSNNPFYLASSIILFTNSSLVRNSAINSCSSFKPYNAPVHLPFSACIS